MQKYLQRNYSESIKNLMRDYWLGGFLIFSEFVFALAISETLGLGMLNWVSNFMKSLRLKTYR